MTKYLKCIKELFLKNVGPAEMSRCICHKTHIYITWFVFVWLMNFVCGESVRGGLYFGNWAVNRQLLKPIR